VEEKSGRSVRHSFGVHGMDEAEIIDVFGDVGEETADPATGLPVLFEIPERFEKFTLTFFPEGGLANANKVEGLAIALDELGLVVEGVDMGRSAGHEEEDDAFGFCGKYGSFRR
jgi:hypothetical protein